MRILKIATKSILLGLLLSCATTIWWEGNLSPKFKGIDPRIMPFVNEWKDLAKLYGIKFTRTVTIGIAPLNYPIVGECVRSPIFREITIDSDYWERSSAIKKSITLFHELEHCYCNRNHVYGAKGDYGDDEKSRFDSSKKDGFFTDGCPVGILYPFVLEESCYANHYSEYVSEMFKNCNPY